MNPDDVAASTGFCPDCPDHEACASGYTCALVKKTAAESFKTAMLGMAEAAKKASAALSSVTVTTRPRMLGGMEGDIVQSVHTTVSMDAGREIVDRCVAEAEAIIKEHAVKYGFTLIGNFDARSRVRNDGPVTQVEIIVEARLRPRTDGVWGEVRAAIAQDAADLAEAKRSVVDISKFASGGMVLAADGPVWGWSAPAGDFAVGTMSVADGSVYTYNGSEWILLATGTVE